MKHKKQPKLPRGLRWHSESRFIWFTWYDSRGRQHKKSTETNEKALLFKMHFLEQETRKADRVESPDLTGESLARAAELYFDWKLADNSPETVSRERRMFKNVLKYFGPESPVKSIRLPQIRGYQKERRQQISPTMKQPVTARSVN